jgi:hypothetical protein
MNVMGLKCADLVDAMGRMHRHRCHILDLVSPTPERILFGPAVTNSYFPSCSAALDPEHYNLANLFYEAVGDDPAGKVMCSRPTATPTPRWAAAQSRLRRFRDPGRPDRGSARRGTQSRGRGRRVSRRDRPRADS